jgi:hypothetical protein
MKPNKSFMNLPKTFWANVRSISEQAGYTIRGEGVIKVPSLPEMAAAFKKMGLQASYILDTNGKSTKLGRYLIRYFIYRAEVLNKYVEPRLMNVERARHVFRQLSKKLHSSRPVPMNKQKKEKKQPAYLTAIVNMLLTFFWLLNLNLFAYVNKV